MTSLGSPPDRIAQQRVGGRHHHRGVGPRPGVPSDRRDAVEHRVVHVRVVGQEADHGAGELGERALDVVVEAGRQLVYKAAWLKGLGGLKAIAKQNTDKAKLIYDAIDESKMFRATARPGSRSEMNICFRASTEQLENEFIAEASKRGLKGLKGHRSVGGMRASVYNAFPAAGCEALVSFIRTFERQHS